MKTFNKLSVSFLIALITISMLGGALNQFVSATSFLYEASINPPSSYVGQTVNYIITFRDTGDGTGKDGLGSADITIPPAYSVDITQSLSIWTSTTPQKSWVASWNTSAGNVIHIRSIGDPNTLSYGELVSVQFTATNPLTAGNYPWAVIATTNSGRGGTSFPFTLIGDNPVTSNEAAIFIVRDFPSPTTAGNSGTFTVTAKDEYGNIATDYIGTANFTSSDRQVVLPANYTFTSGDQGVHTFSATLKTAGTQSISAMDTAASSINGTQNGINVIANVAARLVVSGFPNPSIAGTAHNITITAEDVYGNNVNSYSGAVTIASTDPSAVLPPSGTISHGIGTFSVTLVTIGIWSISATSDSLTGSQINIQVISPGIVAYIVVNPKLATINAGEFQSYSATAFDQYHNYLDDVTGSASWSVNSGSGTYTWTGTSMQVTKASSAGSPWTVTASFSGKSNTSSLTVTPASGGAIHFVVSAPSSANAGSSFSVTVTAKDLYNNTVTNYAGTVNFTSTDSTADLPSNSTIVSGVGSFTITLKTANSQTVTATDTVNSEITGTSGTIVVNPAIGGASRFEVSAPVSVNAGQSFSITIIAEDLYGNIIHSYAGTVHISSSDIQAGLPADNMLSSGTGTFPVTLKTAGPQTVTATDTVHISITGSVLVLVNVDASSTTHFEMSAPSSAIAGQNFYITVTAKDQLGNRVNGYNGTVQFTSNDIQAVLPGDSTLTSGTATFSITLKTAGPRTITAADKSIPSITGTSNNIIVVANDTVPGFILITPSSAIISAGGSQTFKVELFDIYNNSLGEVTSSVNSWGINSGAGTYLWTGNSVTVSKAGDWTVTASYNGVLNATAELVVKGHLPGIISITVTPKTASIAAGTSQSFTATASDGYNTWDVTNQTGWSIDVAAGGLWDQTAGTYTAAKAGNWIITASLNSLSDTATLTVTVNTELFDHIAISPKTSTIAAGQSQLYSATAFDTYGNGWSVTAVYTCPNSNLTITGNSASSTVAGSYTINGTYNSKSASASLTVTHATDVAYLDYITASVSPTSVAAPGLVTGSATAFDTFGNSWVVSTDATWSIPAGNDGGSWSGNVYTSHSAGVYSVEASFGGKTASASLTVTHAADKTYLDHIVIKPKESVVTVSVPQSYTATAYDSFGNNWTATATYTCPNSNVTVTVNLAYSNTAGSYTITGTFNGKVDTATLIVTGHLPTIASITIAPKTASVTTGSSQAFTATASDGYNTWDITNSAKWNINTTAGGAWTGPSYLSAKTGTWTVTATSDGVSDTATLTVIGDSSSSTSATSTSTTNVMPPTKTYTISFKQHGLPDGETWSVTFKGVTKTSTTSIITFGDIAAGDYTWSTDNMINQSDNTRYTMNGANKGSIHVPTITTQIVTYGTQYYLAINSSYSNPIGAGWYDAGSIAQFSIDSQTSTQYSFASWTGTGNGSYTGPDTTASIIINGPITETANWEQTTSLWLVLLITLILFGLLIAIFLAWKKRKKKKEDTAQQQLKQAGNPNPKLHFFGVNQKIISFKLLSLSINFNRSAK